MDSDDDDDDENGIDDEVFAQKMHQQLNSSRPRRAAAMQATAQMMVSVLHFLCLLLFLCQLHHLCFCLFFLPLHASVPRHAPVYVFQAVILILLDKVPVCIKSQGRP